MNISWRCIPVEIIINNVWADLIAIGNHFKIVIHLLWHASDKTFSKIFGNMTM